MGDEGGHAVMSTKKTKKVKKVLIRISTRKNAHGVKGLTLYSRIPGRRNLPKPVDVQRLQSALMREVGPKRARELRAILAQGRQLLRSMDRLSERAMDLGFNFGALAQARVKLQESLMWAGASLSGGE